MSRELKAFLASPGDVKEERESVDRVVDEINSVHARGRYRLELVRWETHVAPGLGSPQEVVNQQLPPYDLFLGLMWRRFGTPTPVAGSGTEEEFQIAYERWETNPRMPIMFYFCQRPFMPRSIAELDQMRQVLAFRNDLEGKALVWDYDSVGQFADSVRKHLCMRIDRLLEDESEPERLRTEPNVATIDLLRALWDSLAPEVQEAFSIAYNENRRFGDGGIKTQDLFSALLRVEPADLRPLVAEIPVEALPTPVAGSVQVEPYILKEQPWLSGCITASIGRLSKHADTGGRISAADIFADIAKHGTGYSVRLLREHGIGPSEIDAIIRAKGMTIVET